MSMHIHCSNKTRVNLFISHLKYHLKVHKFCVVFPDKRKLNTESDINQSEGDSINKPAAHNTKPAAATSSGDSMATNGDWIEATTPEGYVYYWNTVTMGLWTLS